MLPDRLCVQRHEWCRPAEGKKHLHTVDDRKGNQGPRHPWEGVLEFLQWVVVAEEAGRVLEEGASGLFSGETSRTASVGGR